MADLATLPPPITISLQADAIAAAPPERIELQVDLPNTQQCDSPNSEEIVVCAPDSAVYRLGPVSKASNRQVPSAELKLSSNTTIAAQLQAGSLGNAPTNRAMVTVKVAF